MRTLSSDSKIARLTADAIFVALRVSGFVFPEGTSKYVLLCVCVHGLVCVI